MALLKRTKKAETAMMPKPAKKKVDAGQKAALATGVLLRPLLTEKIARMGADRAVAFVIGETATKVQVAQAVQALYGVIPARVNVIRLPGKVMRAGTRFGMRSPRRKAVVFLKKGDHIDVHEGV